jgi:hypothetical protein
MAHSGQGSGARWWLMVARIGAFRCMKFDAQGLKMKRGRRGFLPKASCGSGRWLGRCTAMHLSPRTSTFATGGYKAPPAKVRGA